MLGRAGAGRPQQGNSDGAAEATVLAAKTPAAATAAIPVKHSQTLCLFVRPAHGRRVAALFRSNLAGIRSGLLPNRIVSAHI
ncbi:MAG: hypothetical protein ACLSDQ_12175 [Adlercreutzia equolifaciens]